MGSLTKCLLKHPVGGYQAKRLRVLGDSYRDTGSPDPDLRAAEDILNELLEERADIVKQIVAKGGADPGHAPALELTAQTESDLAAKAQREAKPAPIAADKPENFALTPATKTAAVQDDEAKRSVTSAQQSLVIPPKQEVAESAEVGRETKPIEEPASPHGTAADKAYGAIGMAVDTPTSIADERTLRNIKRLVKENPTAQPLLDVLNGAKRLTKAAEEAHPNDTQAAVEFFKRGLSVLPNHLLDQVGTAITRIVRAEDDFNAIASIGKSMGLSDKEIAAAASWSAKTVAKSTTKDLAQDKASPYEAIAQRAVNARERFVDAVKEQFGIEREVAQRAAAELVRAKLLKLDPITGQFSLTNGDAWNADVIRRVAETGTDEELAAAEGAVADAKSAVDKAGLGGTDATGKLKTNPEQNRAGNRYNAAQAHLQSLKKKRAKADAAAEQTTKKRQEPKAAVMDSGGPTVGAVGSGAVTTESARSKVATFFGRPALRALDSKKLLGFAASVSDLPPHLRAWANARHGVHAFYDPDHAEHGTPAAWIIADRLESVDDVPGLVLHELGVHYNLKRMLGADEFAKLLASLSKDASPAIAEAWAHVLKNYRHKEGSAEFREEVLARSTQQARFWEAPMWKRAWSRLKQFLFRLGFTKSLSDEDLGLLVARSLRTAIAKGSGPVAATAWAEVAAATAESRIVELTDGNEYGHRYAVDRVSGETGAVHRAYFRTREAAAEYREGRAKYGAGDPRVRVARGPRNSQLLLKLLGEREQRRIRSVARARALRQDHEKRGDCYPLAALAAYDGLGTFEIGLAAEYANHHERGDIWHAVVRLPDGSIYDPTYGKFFDAGIYEAAYHFRPVKTMTGDEVADFVRTTGVGFPDAENLNLSVANPMAAMGSSPEQQTLPGVEAPADDETDAVGIKNSEAAKTREARGFPDAKAVIRRDFPTVRADAFPESASDWRDIELLAKELKAKPRAPDDTELAKLLFLRVRLENDLDYADSKIIEAHETGDQADMVPHELRKAAVEKELEELLDVTEGVGTIQGRALNFRRAMMRRDFSLTAMKRKLRAQMKGRELTIKEIADVEALHRRIRSLEKQLEDRDAERESKKAHEDHVKQADENAKDETKAPENQPAAKKKRTRDVLKQLKEAIESGEKPEQYGNLIQRLARALVEGGERNREGLIDGVHHELVVLGAEITRREVMDAISGYGKFSELSKDEIDVELRRMKGEMQQVGKLQDMEAGRAPLKTGMEHRTPNDEERDLIKQVNEMKKRLGIQTTDPGKQLKSALDAMKTRRQNQINDYERAIDNRRRIDRTRSPPPSDDELKRLEGILGQIKSEYEAIFPAEKKWITDAQRARMAERAVESSIYHLERQIKEGDIGHALKPTPATSTKLDALRSRLDALIAERESLRDADPAYQEKKRLDELQRATDEYERKVITGELQPPSKVAPIVTPATIVAEARRDSMRKLLWDARKNIRDQKYVEAALKAVAQSHADYTRRINEGDLAAKEKRVGPTSVELDAARAERAALAKVFRALQQAAKPKKSPEEIALRTLKTRLANETAKLEERIANKDFSVRVPRKVVLDPEAHKQRFELDKLKRTFHEMLMRERIANWDAGQKFWYGLKEFLGLPRALQTMADFSAPLRQGAFIVLGHPIRGAKALPSMWRATFSEEKAHAAYEAIMQRPNATSGLYAQAGLYLAGENGKLSDREEVYLNRWIEKIPTLFGGKIIKAVYKGSERAYVTFLNQLRADSFDAMASTLAISENLTKKEAAGIAYFVNNSTGRGSVFGQQAGGELASAIFYSPRYLTSRLALLTLMPVVKGGSFRGRKAIAMEYLRYGIGLSVVYGLAAMARAASSDDDDRWDNVKRMLAHGRLSSDFGKIVFGKTRIDPLSGFAQVITFSSRIASGHTETLSGKVIDTRGQGAAYGRGGSTIVDRFLQSKLAPTPGLIYGLAVTGEDFKGDPLITGNYAADAKKIGFGALAPLSVQSIVEIGKEHGIPAATALGALAILGVGVQVYNQ